MSSNPLDDAVFAASKELRGRGAPDPDVLLLLGTGVGMLPSSYPITWQQALESVAGVPHAWRGSRLAAAEGKRTTYWFLEDSPGLDQTGNLPAPGEAGWIPGFPCWLAACSGATICVHTSAGNALPADGALAGSLALVRDHINLSGSSPLVGLGESRLGPLFPDQTRLHHRALRQRARRHAERLGLPHFEAVVACTPGPALETPAERAFYARAGAQVAVQGLADRLLAMAHAALACLSIVAVTEGAESAAIERQVREAERLAPALDDLLAALAPDLGALALELREEQG